MNWKTWLERDDCPAVLDQAARQIVRLVQKYHIPAHLLPCDPFDAGTPEARRDCLQEIGRDLWLFARDHAEAWEERFSLALLLAQGGRRVAYFLATRYVNSLRDQARTRRTSPERALYRRLRQCIRSSGEFRSRTASEWTEYACTDGALVSAGLSGLSAENYADWPIPEGVFQGGRYGVWSEEDLLRVARFFWEEAVRRLGGPCWIPIRELVRYIQELFPLPTPPKEMSSESAGPDSDHRFPVDPFPVEPTQEKDLMTKRVKELALNLTASWDDTEKAAFYAYYGKQETLALVARLLGYRGPSGAKYFFKKLNDRIRDFCLLWPGLSPPDLDEDLWLHFMEWVLKSCKAAYESRYG